MTLVVFDLDGTLLNKGSRISSYTADTLGLMRAKGIPYTVATGRTLQAAVAPCLSATSYAALVASRGSACARGLSAATTRAGRVS